MADTIDADKILVGKVFEKWYMVPNYQRQYVWEDEEVNDLLRDICDMYREKSDAQFFLGTYVFRNHLYTPPDGAEPYEQNDLLDGQQRLTTLWLIFAVIRDITADEELRDTCAQNVMQKGSKLKKKPEISRITFAEGMRESVREFADKFIKPTGGTLKEDEINEFVRNHKKDISVVNLANAISTIRKFWAGPSDVSPFDFVQYLLNNVLMIYVSTEDFSDAFRLFTVLNDRGVQLRSSDILKTQNLAAVVGNPKEQNDYAIFWEDAETRLGDEFDRFLNHIRTILVKEKAKATLLAEFEDKIYHPKDGKTGLDKPPLMHKGKETFDFIKKYLDAYESLFDKDHNDACGDYKFDNLKSLMVYAAASSDWVPPLLSYYSHFGLKQIEAFFAKLVKKFIGDWLSQITTTDRIEQMNHVLKEIEACDTPDQLFATNVFDFKKADVAKVLDGPVYGRRFALSLVLLIDYMLKDHTEKMTFSRVSIEHILPQTPKDGSNWKRDFTDDQRADWQDRIGNLIAMSGAKNASQGRLDYAAKCEKYFAKRIPGFAHSQQVMQNYTKWTMNELLENQGKSVRLLNEFFCGEGPAV